MMNIEFAIYCLKYMLFLLFSGAVWYFLSMRFLNPKPKIPDFKTQKKFLELQGKDLTHITESIPPEGYEWLLTCEGDTVLQRSVRLVHGNLESSLCSGEVILEKKALDYFLSYHGVNMERYPFVFSSRNGLSSYVPHVAGIGMTAVCLRHVREENPSTSSDWYFLAEMPEMFR